MPDDAIGSLGLDAEPFKKAVKEAVAELEGLNKSATKTNAKLGSFFAGVGAVYVLSHLKQLGEAITGLGKSAEEAIDKFQAGGSRIAETSPDRQASALSVGMTPIVEDKTTSFVNKVKSAGLGTMTAIGGMLSKLTGGKEGAEQYWDGVEAITKEGEAQLQQNEKIAGLQDEIAIAVQVQTPEMASQLAILDAQLKLQEEKLKLANLETVQGRKAANDAREAIGAVKMQIDAMTFQRQQADAMAIADTQAMALKQGGMKNIADMLKSEASYTARINQARREGNTLLADQLELQKQMAQKELAAKEHNLSPAQLREERAAARKMERDARHQAAREKDIQDRIDRGAHGQTKGSRADRFRAEQEARAAAVPKNMTVSEMKVATMKVSIP